jgi:predicted MPP superfamily phosphohydrolase
VKNSLEKILFIPDCHFPYHDKRAWELLLKVAKDFKPEHVIIGGDFIDNYTVSSHDKNPNRALKLEEEVNETKKALDQVKALGAKNNQFIAGNHEDRLERYLMTKAPELFNFISTEKVLDLKDKGFKYTPYKHTYKLGKLNITHDTGTAGKYAHYKALDTYQHNVIINHTHRIGYAVEGSAANERHVTAMFGWLGDVEQVDYMHKVKAKRDWSLGFGLGYLEKSTGNVFVVPVPIVNYSVVVEGKLFKV